MSNFPPVFMLMGPTASGKTGLSLFLADNLPVEIVSVDSALVYQGMDIGTSKPNQQTLKNYPHHLIDICSPVENYSAAQFRQDAENLMREITLRGNIPLLVGGTMLYYRALIQGLSNLPAANQSVRKELEQFVDAKGLPALYARLQQVDPQAAERIHSNDPQRIQRALEVYEISGKPISQWWAEQAQYDLPYSVTKIAVTTTARSLLHQRIEARFEQMLTEGLIDELSGLRERFSLDLNKPAMRTVGYRQVWQYLEGDYSFSDMKYKAIVATRQLAKRQLTWLRSEQDVHWLYADQGDIEQMALNLFSHPPH